MGPIGKRHLGMICDGVSDAAHLSTYPSEFIFWTEYDEVDHLCDEREAQLRGQRIDGTSESELDLDSTAESEVETVMNSTTDM